MKFRHYWSNFRFSNVSFKTDNTVLIELEKGGRTRNVPFFTLDFEEFVEQNLFENRTKNKTSSTHSFSFRNSAFSLAFSEILQKPF